MWQVIHRTKEPSWTAVVTSRYDMAIPVFFNRVQLLSDDPHKIEMKNSPVQQAHLYSVIPSQLNVAKIVPSS